MGADDAALLALDKRHTYHVTVSEPSDSDEGEMGNPAQLDWVDFTSKAEALQFCNHTALRGLRACLYDGAMFLGEFE